MTILDSIAIELGTKHLYFSTIYGRLANLSRREMTTCLRLAYNLSLKYENKKDIVSLKVINFIHYMESLMLLETYLAAFHLFIFKRFYIKQE